MSLPPLVRGAVKVLAKEELAARSLSSEARSRAVEAIRGALVARGRSRVRKRWLTPLVAAAALFLVAGAVWSTRPSPVEPTPRAQEANVTAESVRGVVFVARGGARVQLEEHGSVASGESIASVDGEAVFALRSGTKIDVEPGTEVAVVADGETELVRLARGAVTSRVAKLRGSQRFLVRTAEADVEVRGTVFRVSREGERECGERTRVHVDEGRVAVRGPGVAITLEPGEEWASPCAVPVPIASAPPSASTAGSAPSSPLRRVTTLPSPSSSSRATRVAPPGSSSSTSSELTAQNAAFAEAMAAKARGEPSRAVAALDAFLQTYPRSPLREAAEAQRMNILVGIDRARARAAAKEYLARYPRGFARADAEAIAPDLP